jgi:prepilin peptidase CpaA
MFFMYSFAWWPTLFVLAVSTIVDIRSRRIPNWLVLPFLLLGVVASLSGFASLSFLESVQGVGLAALIGGVLCWLRGVGAGDLKLAIAIGAWIGPSQLIVALVVTGITGGIMAVLWAAYYRRLDECLQGTGDLLATWKTGVRPQATFSLDNPKKLTMPYAPAIAVGTLFSFFGA